MVLLGLAQLHKVLRAKGDQTRAQPRVTGTRSYSCHNCDNRNYLAHALANLNSDLGLSCFYLFLKEPRYQPSLEGHSYRSMIALQVSGKNTETSFRPEKCPLASALEKYCRASS